LSARTLARVAGATWATALLGLLLAAAVLGEPARAALAEDGPGCALRTLSGIPCPFCGMSHATVALAGGDLAGALAWHPLAPLLLPLSILAGIDAARGRRAWLLRPGAARVVLAAIAVVWAVRLAVPLP